eukprot:TRINITY_DN17657_c0_g1_i2.p1 TRINITY_DN17657_c0_g1~~TRINITY_DN17657_c0_g1_i2.p1  ORF type:complete len:522 (-),score=65.87 TRINITY_DN17657_c0_g1_i2:122-1687(-)
MTEMPPAAATIGKLAQETDTKTAEVKVVELSLQDLDIEEEKWSEQEVKQESTQESTQDGTGSTHGVDTGQVVNQTNDFEACTKFVRLTYPILFLSFLEVFVAKFLTYSAFIWVSYVDLDSSTAFLRGILLYWPWYLIGMIGYTFQYWFWYTGELNWTKMISPAEAFGHFLVLGFLHCLIAALPVHFGALVGGLIASIIYWALAFARMVNQQGFPKWALIEYNMIDQPVFNLGSIGMLATVAYPFLVDAVGELTAGILNTCFFRILLEGIFLAQRMVAIKYKHAGERFRWLSAMYSAINGMVESFAMASLLNNTLNHPDSYLWILPMSLSSVMNIIGRLGYWHLLLVRRPPTIEALLRRDGRFFSGYAKFVGPGALLLARLVSSPSKTVPWYLNMNFPLCTLASFGDTVFQDVVSYLGEKAGLEAKYPSDKLRNQKTSLPFCPAYGLDDDGKQVKVCTYTELPLTTGAMMNMYYIHYTACMCVVGLLMTNSVSYMVGISDTRKPDLTDGTVLWALPDSFWHT